jgi:hypothetical protein
VPKRRRRYAESISCLCQGHARNLHDGV